MAKLKRLAQKEDNIATIKCPVTSTKINSRSLDYPLLTPVEFAKKYRGVLFRPANFHLRSNEHSIDMNTCTDPFCKWFGLHQARFETVKFKPSRYKLVGSLKHGSQAIACNPDPISPSIGVVTNSTTLPLSNWSIAEEIARLATNDSICDIEPQYEFHKEGCSSIHLTPFESPKAFYRQGKSSAKSQKWQCKECKKNTNVLPKREQTTSYHQKRNDILHSFAHMVINRIPVRRACEILQIGSKTYYDKLEILYRRCLEFLERNETKTLPNVDFKSLYLNTDKMIYYLNNVRKRGQGGIRYNDLEEKHFPTHIVVSSDVSTRYVFRTDIAYDWNISLTDVEADTVAFKEDHLNEFARKNARLRRGYQFCPQPPTPNDTESVFEYQKALQDFERRGKYIDGLHLNSTYTTIAHLWLIKQMLNVKEWRFVTDEDESIMTAIFRVFAREVRLGEAHHFLCKIEKSKSLRASFTEFQDSRKDLKSWGLSNGYISESLSKLAFLKLTEIFKTHSFHEMVTADGKTFPQWARKPIEHPLATVDQGYRWVDCTTDLSAYDPEEIANMVFRVNDRSTNNFMQIIRRRISILERPLVTARGEGKSYIYANFNPKYAQYALTILRTYYNFCMTYKTKNKVAATPAQRLGITDRQYTLKDIIYFK